MKLKRNKAILYLAVLLAIAGVAPAQQGALDPTPPKDITPEQIIQKFAAKESEFRAAREKYTYRQTVKVQTLEGGRVDGEYQMVSDIIFEPNGRRTERVVFAPQSSLRRIMMTKEDFDDIQNRLPFVLTSEDIPAYNVTYAGQQHVDELDTYVFDVAPKVVEKGKRYFEGRIWVDKQDLQIVKTEGKTVPDIRSRNGENLFPKFTTYREQIDGKYWFPTYTRADDVLKFSLGEVPMRIIMKYENYKRFGSDVRITYEGQELPQGQQPQTQQPQPPAPGNKPK